MFVSESPSFPNYVVKSCVAMLKSLTQRATAANKGDNNDSEPAASDDHDTQVGSWDLSSKSSITSP